LRTAQSKLNDLNDRYDVLRQNLNAEVADFESQLDEIQSQIAAKRKELSEMEATRQSEEAAIWHELGLRPRAERRENAASTERPERATSFEEPHESIDFQSLILETLRDVGGRGNVRDVLGRIESKLRDQGKLTSFWLALDPNQVRWVHATHTARVHLKKQGKLSGRSERGIWELTDDGRRTRQH
jgi:chromosome segregation ATPase